MTSVLKKKSIFEKLNVQNKDQVFSKILDLKKKESILDAYVFGSFAKDTFNADSDIDVIFILKDGDLENVNFIERPLLFDDLNKLPIKIDLLIYSVNEFENIKKEEKNLFWKSVFESIIKIK